MNTIGFRIAFVFVAALFFQLTGYATHIVGGDIFLRWTGEGNRYQILLNKYVNENSYYQDQYGADAIEEVILQFGNAGFVQKTEKISVKLISNTFLTDNSNYCVNPTVVKTSLQVYTTFIDLDLFMNYQEWTVGWQRCCRNSTINNITRASLGNNNFQEQEVYLFTKKYQIKTINTTPFFKRLSNEYFCKDVINTFDMSATDAEGDSLVYSLISPQKSENSDVFWVSGYNGNNPVKGTISIDAHSGQMTFIPPQTGIFVFGIKVLEYRNKVLLSQVRKDFQFNVQSCVANNKPVIDFKNPSQYPGAVVEAEIKGETCVPIYITDIDASQFGVTEFIKITTTTDFPPANMRFADQVTLNATADTLVTNLCITPCLLQQLTETTDFDFHIVINDVRCPAQYDTLDFVLKVVVPDNSAPSVIVLPALDPQAVRIDSLLIFGVFGTDADPADLLSLTLLNSQRGMNFQHVSDSTSTISSTFRWTPNCDDRYPGLYDVYFVVTDNSCIYSHADTLHQQIVVLENEVSLAQMRITNLVTPNGDGQNDFYLIPGIPTGNCSKYFKGIEIYNRWGARVYYSQDRFFQWVPEVSDGIYYYSIDLNDEVKKGWIQVTR